MPEKGAPPKVKPLQRKVLNAIRAFTSPLLPDDYLELINPLWSTRELKGKVEDIVPETDDAATIVIRPGYEWEGHEAGQYLRIGLDINGRRHWRAYSLTSDPGRPDGCITITIKNVDEGTVSPYLVRRGRPGTIVSLGGVQGEFVLPDELPEKMLFISAGSGITPIMSMLRSLSHRDELQRRGAAALGARRRTRSSSATSCAKLEEKHDGFKLHKQLTGDMGRFKPADLDELCPDWRERETFLSGPAELIEADRGALRGARRLRPPAHGALPARARQGRGGRGREDQVPRQRRGGGVGRLTADPRRGRGRRPDAPVRMS